MALNASVGVWAISSSSNISTRWKKDWLPRPRGLKQTAGGFRFLGNGGIDRRIKLVSYYEMFGYPCSFDSAVVQLPDRPPPPPPPATQITLDGKNFRSVYCVLTGQTVGSGKNKDVADLCKHTGGH